MICREDCLTLDYGACGLEPPKEPARLLSYVSDRSGDFWWKPERPAVIVCPGGGYRMLCEREGEPVALRFAGAGCAAFVLRYSVEPVRFPAALLELSLAVALVRSRAEEYQIDPNRIAVCGFSAGGHLAASLGVYWRRPFVQRCLDLNGEENRPNGLVLGYPVLSGKPGVVHKGSAERLLGKYPGEETSAMFSLEEQVSADTPPAFLWHGADDGDVSPENSLLFAQALQKKGIPFELHIYPHCEHGSSLCDTAGAGAAEQVNPAASDWVRQAVRFLEIL